jgi:MFS family permease
MPVTSPPSDVRTPADSSPAPPTPKGGGENALSLADLRGFLIGIAAIAALAELGFAIVNISTIPVYVKFGLNLPSLVGTTIAAFLLAEALLNGPMGHLADRLGRRHLMVAGPLISVFTCIATAFLRIPVEGTGHYAGIIALYVLRMIDGAGAAMLWPAVFAAIGDRAGERHQGAAMGTLNVAYMMGLAFGPLVGGGLNDFFARSMQLPPENPVRYAPSFFSAALFFLICAIIGFVVAPRQTDRSRSTTETDGSDPSLPGGIKSALKRMPLLLFLVFLIFLGIGLISPNIKLFAMERFGVAETKFGFLLLIPALIIAAISVPAGRLADRWGNARAIHVGLGICALALWLILLLETEWALVVLGTLLGVGFVLAFPAYMALISRIAGDAARGGVIGAVRTAQGIGMLLGAAAASPVYEIGHLIPFIVAGVLLSAGFFISLAGIKK